MADNNNMPKYGEKPSAADTIPFEKFDPATGGFKPVSVDQESDKMTYKYFPPSETFAGSPSKVQPYVGIPQTDKPLWSFVKHVPIDNNVSYFLEDRVTPNPDKEFKSVLKDRYGRHIMFKGTREQTLEYAQNWDFQHADLEKSDFPKLEFESNIDVLGLRVILPNSQYLSVIALLLSILVANKVTHTLVDAAVNSIVLVAELAFPCKLVEP